MQTTGRQKRDTGFAQQRSDERASSLHSAPHQSGRRLRQRSARTREVCFLPRAAHHADGACGRPRLRQAAARARLAEVSGRADRARHQCRARRQQRSHRRCRRQPVGNRRARIPASQPAHARARRRRGGVSTARSRRAQHGRVVVGSNRAGARGADRAAPAAHLYGRRRAVAQLHQGRRQRDRGRGGRGDRGGQGDEPCRRRAAWCGRQARRKHRRSGRPAETDRPGASRDRDVRARPQAARCQLLSQGAWPQERGRRARICRPFDGMARALARRRTHAWPRAQRDLGQGHDYRQRAAMAADVRDGRIAECAHADPEDVDPRPRPAQPRARGAPAQPAAGLRHARCR